MKKLTVRVGVYGVFLLLCVALVAPARASIDSPLATQTPPDWSAQAQIPVQGRANIYGWDEATWALKIQRGKRHALHYPVSVTGLQMPARPTLRVLDLEPGEPLFGFLRSVLKLRYDIQSFKGFWRWLGLHDYPESSLGPAPRTAAEVAAAEYVPAESVEQTRYPMGVTVMREKRPAADSTVLTTVDGASVHAGGGAGVATRARDGAEMVTLSCAACHSASLFGKPVMGLTNRFPRANEFFILGQGATQKVAPGVFQIATGSTRAEKELYAYTRDHIRSVGLRAPQVLGLDTSLAQVALSLAKRKQDAWATRSRELERSPRPNFLDTHIADSKPAVWWNVKYKTHWLSDGSVLSGNPIFTNLIWNEIGRGADLPELVEWMNQNTEVIEDLTTAVFASRAPKWKDYLGSVAPIRVERARRGAEVFAQACASCHGQYLKDWNRPGVAALETVEVRYFAQTFVKDVGTDPGRREGMRALAEGLNPLEISRRGDSSSQIVIEEQKGYVPPPLEGIWARYPYFHNNSVPNLCALMTPPAQRPVVYVAGEPLVPGRDYDLDCVGYPVGDRAPAAWREDPAYLFDTRREGMSNAGHYERIFTRDGQERFSPEQKRDLIEFLKTL